MQWSTLMTVGGGYDITGWYNINTDALDLNAKARAVRIENLIRL